MEPGSSLGKNLDGIIKPVSIPEKVFKYGIGYVPSKEGERKMKREGLKSAKSLPPLYQSFPVSVKPTSNGLGAGIRNLFEQCDAIMEDFPEKTEIKEDEP